MDDHANEGSKLLSTMPWCCYKSKIQVITLSVVLYPESLAHRQGVPVAGSFGYFVLRLLALASFAVVPSKSDPFVGSKSS